MNGLFDDLTAALRHLRRAPAFSLLAIAMLALGIGANVAIFSIFQSIVLRPLPYPQPERLVGFKSLNAAKALTQPALSLSDFRDLRGRVQSYSALAAFRPDFVGYAPAGADPVQLVCGRVTEEFLAAFGVTPRIGRPFQAGEFSYDGARVAILSHAAWQRHFAGDPAAVGRTAVFDGEAVTIIGVMPEDFREPEFADVWLPFPAEAPENLARDSRFWTTVGRLKPGVSVAAAQAEATAIAAALAREYPATNRGWGMAVQPLLELRVGGLRASLLLLLGAVGLVLLIACVNLANLMLARGVSRVQELAVRLAIGATPARLARAVLLESVLLALAGGTAGVALAMTALPALAARLPAGLVPRSHAIAVDGAALGFAVAVSVVTGLVFGVLPAWQVWRADVNHLIKAGGGRGGSNRFAHRVQGALIVGQVALTVVVLAGAGLLLRSLLSLQRTAPGFAAENVVTLRISPPPARWQDFRELADYYERVLAELRREPGVEGVDLNCSAPFSGITLSYPFWVQGRPVEDGNADEAVFNSVGVDYLRVLRIPLVRGRGFEPRDNATGAAGTSVPPVCLVNVSLARRLFGDADPIGQRIRTVPWLTNGYREIVGVVADVKQTGAAEPPGAQVYVPFRQSPWFFATLLVRTRTATAAALQAAVRRADPTLTMSVSSMEDAIAASATQPRLRAWLFGCFAVIALGLSAFGIYASMAFTVGQRTREIGVRLALGASPGGILAWVLGRAGRLALVGVSCGLVAALATTRLLRAALYGVTPTDPTVLILLVFGLPLVVLAAAFGPAWRAARLEPTRALQAE
ncbi:ABC transporter permease [Opitutus sp. ER46]|uniref:ABC transporter permease n=1 Tax=Opitutus sp. ER46 TaxID=2161864 RepID=UPI000D2FAFB7|nr:ABC transporter permease [Opitutus sp. ER46]PTX97788.1 permease [Opitutus sp. ER46]